MLGIDSRAPDFTLKDQHGVPVTLSSFRGAKDVLLVFFPLAFTPVCLGELAEIGEDLPVYVNERVQTLTVSVGPPPTHRVWAEQSGFRFPILSDFWPHGAVARDYGVFDEGTGFPNRGTFVIDASGTVRFAEMMAPGQPRDQAGWIAALGALRSD